MSAGKDATLDPGTERTIEVASDEVEEAAAGVSDGATDDVAEFANIRTKATLTSNPTRRPTPNVRRTMASNSTRSTLTDGDSIG